jgi:hypothetical protein
MEAHGSPPDGTLAGNGRDAWFHRGRGGCGRDDQVRQGLDRPARGGAGARVTILVRGELAEVEAAVAAGTAAAAAVGELLRGHVIPAPAMDLESVILARPSTTR